MTVLQFPMPQEARNQGYMTCECGSAWFELRTFDSQGEERPGAVSINEAGRITGFTGELRCADCGRAKRP